MKKILTRSFLLVVCLLVGAEIIVRIFFSQNASGRFDYGYNPTAGFVEEEFKVKLVRAGGRRFRPQEFAMPKPKGIIRIFTVGDSVPRGNSLESAYPKQIENFLRIYGLQVESINLSVAGNGARRNQIILKQILKYEPDFVILHLNDSNEFEDEREWNRAQEFNSWHPKNWLMKSFVLRRLYEIKTEQIFWELLPTEVRSQTAKNDFDAKLMAMNSEVKEAEWKSQITKIVTEDIELLRQAHVKTILVSKALRNLKTNELTNTWMYDLAESLKAPDISHVSMYELLKGQDMDKIFNAKDTSHMHDYGHTMLASTIATRIMDFEMPPEEPARLPEPKPQHHKK